MAKKRSYRAELRAIRREREFARIDAKLDRKYEDLLKAELESIEREKRVRNCASDIRSGRIFGFWAGKADLGRMATPAGELRKLPKP